MSGYSAVVLTDKSRSKLLKIVPTLIPNFGIYDRVIAHHMTINMGPLPQEKRQYIGRIIPLYVTSFGFSDKAFAVGLSKNLGYSWLSTNEIPHITVAINSSIGGKPVDSNFITNWKTMQTGIALVGTVTEIF